MNIKEKINNGFKSKLIENNIKDDVKYTIEQKQFECTQVSILQFNILADYLSNSFYDYVYKSDLNWGKRLSKIISIIKFYNPDIITLQEIDKCLDITNQLPNYNYKYNRKFTIKSTINHDDKGDDPDPNQNQEIKNNQPVVEYKKEGCMTLWKSDKFELFSFGLRHYSDGGSQIVQLLRLYSKTLPHKSFIIVNTHLKSKKGYELTRHNQSKELITFTHNFSNNNEPIIISGDFNADPEELSIEIVESEYVNLYPKSLNHVTTYKKRNDKVSKRTIDYIFL